MRRFVFCLAVAAANGCAAAPRGPMQRGLDASMERLLRTEQYIRTVTGLTSDGERLMRGDGYIYLSDVAPQLRYHAQLGDTAAYRKLRGFAASRMVLREGGVSRLRRRVRGGSPFEEATLYGAHRFSDALGLGWRLLGDTASAILAASLNASMDAGLGRSRADQMAERCADAEALVATDPGAGRKLLRDSRFFNGGTAASQVSALGLRGADGDLVAFSCLTRIALALKDPDGTVRFLDRLLEQLKPFLVASGRPDPGVGADILLTLRAVRAAGPSYYSFRR